MGVGGQLDIVASLVARAEADNAIPGNAQPRWSEGKSETSRMIVISSREVMRYNVPEVLTIRLSSTTGSSLLAA